MIFVRELLIALVLNLNIFRHIIELDDRPLKGSMAPMIDLDAYGFKDLNTENIAPQEYFTHAYED